LPANKEKNSKKTTLATPISIFYTIFHRGQDGWCTCTSKLAHTHQILFILTSSDQHNPILRSCRLPPQIEKYILNFKYISIAWISICRYFYINFNIFYWCGDSKWCVRFIL